MESRQISYVRHFVRLSLWYTHHLVSTDTTSLTEALNQRVNIYRLTDLYDGVHHPAQGDHDARWAWFVAELGRLYDRHRARPEAFEARGLEWLWPRLRARLGRASASASSARGARPFECWWFDHHGEHIANAYRPRSPLGEMWAPFGESLRRLLRHVREAHPHVSTVGCASWLNDVPRFAQLFPPAWSREATVIEPIDYTMGHWGQFTDRRGDFHFTNGRRLRETGRLPFRCLRCRCAMDELEEHLERVLARQEAPRGERRSR